MSFADRLAARVAAVGSPTCVGLDPHPDRVPGVVVGAPLDDMAQAVRRFCLDVIEVVAPHVAAVKPQAAFFEALGGPGVAVLAECVAAARDAGLIVVLDAKRGDIGSTAEAYARATLDDSGPIGADAVTLSPYLGPESLEPFARRFPSGKGAFVLVRTSNPGAGPWQVETGIAERVAAWVAEHASGAGAVVAATLPAGEAAAWRQRMPDAWFLVPGFGAQGAGVEQVREHFRADGAGALITSSREVLFPRTGREQPGDRDGLRARCEEFVGSFGRGGL